MVALAMSQWAISRFSNSSGRGICSTASMANIFLERTSNQPVALIDLETVVALVQVQWAVTTPQQHIQYFVKKQQSTANCRNNCKFGDGAVTTTATVPLPQYIAQNTEYQEYGLLVLQSGELGPSVVELAALPEESLAWEALECFHSCISKQQQSNNQPVWQQ